MTTPWNHRHTISVESPTETTRRATIYAPAKLNLSLAVGGKRSDGYHEVSTLMQTLDLADRIDIDIDLWDSDEYDVLVEAEGVPGGDTLVTRTVEKFLERVNQGVRVWITIEKVIPIGGGLGGGSSDAATVLHGINTLMGYPLSKDELHEIACEIGSDVPFFLLGPEATAYCTGRGETVQQIRDIPPRSWLLVNPGVEQLTQAVYENYNPQSSQPLPRSARETVTRVRRGEYRNDLSQSALECCAELKKLYDALNDAGAEPLICGSGCTIAVAINNLEEQQALEQVAKLAAPNGWVRHSWTTPAPLRRTSLLDSVQ